MSKKALVEQEVASILAQVIAIDKPMSLGEIEQALPFTINSKTLQRRIKSMLASGVLLSHGMRSHTKYYVNREAELSLKVGKVSGKETISGEDIKRQI